jgi:hypothetical protein
VAGETPATTGPEMMEIDFALALPAFAFAVAPTTPPG